MRTKLRTGALLLGIAAIAGTARAQPAAPPPIPRPTFANVAYAPPEPADGKGHLLDLYLPAKGPAPAPLVIWTGGSAWLADTGKAPAWWIAAKLNPLGYAVAGVSIRSSRQARFPAQVHDIKAAIRWLRANAARLNLDPARIAIMGDSSGGWASMMAAVTGDVPALEGTVGTRGVSSAVQAAVAFYPPTDFLTMDRWAPKPCTPGLSLAEAGRTGGFCHDNPDSPESSLIGCTIQTCAAKVEAADPARYVSRADPPILIFHGQSDPIVPHQQGERLYQALNKICHDAIFVSLPRGLHGPASAFLSDDRLREAATIRSTKAQGCVSTPPEPYRPDWTTILDFLQTALRLPARPAPAARPPARQSRPASD
ncbi:MAG TPA: alpha/beta hydrolase [Sphingomonadaceae bacterium]|nr:alpha/beta hydrolase [Sphingomonadaceae bacterium]